MVPFRKLASYVLRADSVTAPRVLVPSASSSIEEKRTQQPPAVLSEEETGFGAFGWGRARREGCSACSRDSGATAVPVF